MNLSGHFRCNLTTFSLLNSGNSAVLHSPKLSTNMVVDLCTLNIQTCMIHYFNQNVTADAKMYHTWLYVECTKIYDHICTQFWRSVSASGHGNVGLKQLPPPTRVRSPGPQPVSMMRRANLHDLHTVILHSVEISDLCYLIFT